MDEYNEVSDIYVNNAHVFVLGAGASIAAFPKGDKDQRMLPSMQNLISTLELEHFIPEELSTENNFEIIYSMLCGRDEYSKNRKEVEERIRAYFISLNVDHDASIYDYLLLSLRPKDVIATFNWDPFLAQCYMRNDYKFHGKLPRIVFLHGNVEVAYCPKCMLAARKDNFCHKCNEELMPSRLLYPIQKKNYDNDCYIKSQWEQLGFFLQDAYMMTIFGYSAPESDVSAKEKIFDAWRNRNRNKQQFDIVEIVDKPNCSIEALQNNWGNFIYSHHSRVYDNIFDSFALKHPRRSGEAFKKQYIEANFIPDNSPPMTTCLDELWKWYENIIEAE